MSLYEILPFESVGGIGFGSSPDEVRKYFGGEFRTFNRAATQPFPSDHFIKLGIFAYYNASEKLEAVEMTSPAHALLNGQDLSALNFSQLRAFLEGRDSNLKINIDGLIAHSLGVSAWAPEAKENPNAPCETILAFARGYYD